MIVSVEALPADHRFDVCIAGSGPAGMTLALALAEKGKSVLLLEGGEAEYSERSQRFYAGENAGDPYHDLDVVRLRQLGGTSNHWGGWCRPLDEIDFQFKPHSPEARWPISRRDLDPYLSRALSILDAAGDFSDSRLNDALTSIVFLISDPMTYFGTKYAPAIAASSNLVLAMPCTLTGIECGSGRVSRFTISDFDGVTRSVEAETFVMACGGIENNRLLMHFNRMLDDRLVSAPALLGRYWMEHPTFTIGEVIATGHDDQDREYFGVTPEFMMQAGVLNCGLRLEWSRGRKGLRRLAHSLSCAAPALGQWAYSWVDKKLVCGGVLRAAWEQEPNPDSRLRLSETRRDAFGIPAPVLEWRKTARDIATVRAAAVELGAHLARTGRGRLKLHDWVMRDGPWPLNDEFGGYHHLGGTRMSETPERGVVDPNLRLWGMDNLYLAGSSVFPSGGHANPTLTIVQLSLRLADHLA